MNDLIIEISIWTMDFMMDGLKVKPAIAPRFLARTTYMN